MANIVLGVTGSVAAIYTAELTGQLQLEGHAVKIVATQPATYFFDYNNPKLTVIQEQDEWPGFAEGKKYQRGDSVVHIELRRWGELLLMAPIDANTIAKLANGLADNCLTCVYRAWERTRPIILAPAMNTLMWEHPATARHLRQIAFDAGLATVPATTDLPELMAWINAQCPLLQIVPPQQKKLACEDVGVGAMASLEDIVQFVKKSVVSSQ